MKFFILPVGFILLLCACASAPIDTATFTEAFFANKPVPEIAAGALLVLTDTEGVIVYVSPELKKIVGYTDAELARRDFRQFLLHADSLADDKKALAIALSSRKPVNTQEDMLTRDGTIFYAKTKVTVLRDALGNPVGVSREMTRGLF